MERSSLQLAALHGLHTTLVLPFVSPGLPEYAILNVAICLCIGVAEHWLRYWDALAAHELLISAGKEGIFDALLYASGDRLLIWEGAMLSTLVYLTSAVVSAMLWLYIRSKAETLFVRQSLRDCWRIAEEKQ
eukprot:scaffold114677_cov38-Prasinocladus_malaysianus.AAC.1